MERVARTNRIVRPLALLGCAALAPCLAMGTCAHAHAAEAGSGKPKFLYKHTVKNDEDLATYFLGPASAKYSSVKLHPAPLLSTPSVNALGVHLRWRPVLNADGYRIYRKKAKTGTWKRVADTSGATLGYNDPAVMPNTRYRYTVVALCAGGQSRAVAPFSVKVPAVPKPSHLRLQKTRKHVIALWQQGRFIVDGFEVQYATNRLFKKARVKVIYEGGDEPLALKRPKKGKKLYVRVRAFKYYGGKTSRSAWSTSRNVTGTVTLTPKRVTVMRKVTVKVAAKGKKAKKGAKTKTMLRRLPFELRSAAGQGVGGYDTVQGACSDGRFAYFALYNRSVEKCKIAKVRLSNMRIVKVSKVLSAEHGNDLAYNPRTKRVLIANITYHQLRVTSVKAKTLKYAGQKRIRIPRKLKGATSNQVKAATGILALTYRRASNRYFAMLRGSRNVLELDSKFRARRYITLSKKPDQTIQGIEASGDYLLVAEAALSHGNWNRVSVYDWTGKHVSTLRLRNYLELENVFFARGDLYTSFYRSSSSRTKKGKVQVNRENFLYRVKGF